MDIMANQVNIDFILDERARELCGETTRWYGPKRTGQLLPRLCNTNYAPTLVNRSNGVYGSNVVLNIKDFHVLRPIPQQEIDRSSGKTTQNPGY